MKLKKRIKKSFQRFLQSRGYNINSIYNINFFESLLYLLAKRKGVVSFIQIGANDGQRFDPIYQFVSLNKTNVKGYVLEPVKDYFNDLCDTYNAYPNIIPVNIAIHEKLDEVNIYRVAKKFEKDVPEFALGIASFDKDHHKKTGIPEEFMIEERVKCMSFKGFLSQHNIEALDVLILDTEGYDYSILKGIDFKKHVPSIIYFEHGLKSETMSLAQFEELSEMLKGLDYQLFVDQADVTAYRTNLIYNFDKG